MSLQRGIHDIRALSLVIVKRNVNKALNNAKYADIGDLMAVLQPELNLRQMAVACEPGCLRFEADNIIQKLDLVVTRIDGEKVERFEKPCEWIFPGDIRSRETGGSAVNVAMRQGMAGTYATRYIIGRFFHCVFGDDEDAQRLGAGMARASSATVSDSAPWHSLMNLGWQEVPGPDGTPLGDLKKSERDVLWQKDPANKALMAWAGDRIVIALENSGFAWPKFAEWAGGGLPAKLEDCTPAQLRAAFLKAQEIPDA